jgi:predicted dienelactone hydrolase
LEAAVNEGFDLEVTWPEKVNERIIFLTLIVLFLSSLFYTQTDIDAAAARQATSSEPGVLPTPTGTLAIGRVTVHWTDNARIEPLATRNRRRELMLDIWYPAELKAGPRARYLDVAAFEQALGVEGLRGLLGRHAADLLKTSRLQTHAVEGAPFARSVDRSPVLIFSHGMGTVSQIHTAQIEDLVSHGYVVAAITHTYDAWLTVFPDGRRIPFERIQREAAGRTEEQRIAYEDTRVEVWANDISFVLNELALHNRMRSPAMPFAGHLDLDRVGAFGHSVGGRAAARACQLDGRLHACANQDGVARMLPFYLSEEGWGMDQPFLLIVRERTSPPNDDELRRVGLTRPQADSLIGQLGARRDSTLGRTGGGSSRIVLNFAATDHMSFSDLPMLQARDNDEADMRARVFGVTRDYTRAFFDRTLRRMKAPLLDEAEGEFVDVVQKYPPVPGRPHEK